MNFSELTIVCLTYERHLFIARLIKYWAKNFYSAKIYILDGSNNYLDDRYLNTTKYKNIKYLHLKNSSYFERFCYIKKILKTKYFQLVADDEFFLKSGVEKCIKFLDKHPDYSACCGETILFSPLLKKEVFALAPYSLYTNDDLNDGERVKKWLKFSQPNSIYSISRSKNYIKILNECCKFDDKIFPKPENFLEDFVEIGQAYLGKTKIIKNLMWLRSSENSRIDLGSDQDKPEQLLFNKTKKKEKIFFDKLISEYFKNIKKNNLENNLINLKREYYDRLESIRYRKKKKILKFISNLKNFFLNNFFSIKLKKTIRFYLKLNGIELLNFLENRRNEIIYNKKEVISTKKFIIDFYNNKFYR